MKRIALISGIVTVLLLDLLALEDLTTTSDWAMETVFLLASIPALLTMVHHLRRDRSDWKEGDEGADEAPEAKYLRRPWAGLASGSRHLERSEIHR